MSTHWASNFRCQQASQYLLRLSPRVDGWPHLHVSFAFTATPLGPLGRRGRPLASPRSAPATGRPPRWQACREMPFAPAHLAVLSAPSPTAPAARVPLPSPPPP